MGLSPSPRRRALEGSPRSRTLNLLKRAGRGGGSLAWLWQPRLPIFHLPYKAAARSFPRARVPSQRSEPRGCPGAVRGAGVRGRGGRHRSGAGAPRPDRLRWIPDWALADADLPKKREANPEKKSLRGTKHNMREVMEVFDRSPTDKELVSQAKALCRDYINSRLIRAGVSWSKPEYNAPVPGGKLAEVSSILLRLGDELEYIRPNVYRNIARQLNISLHSETVVTDAFLAVAAQIFTAGITWGKVVSLYAVAAGLAVDCVRHAQPAMVHTIVDCLGEFVRKTLVTWLKRRGGWADITKCVVNTDPSLRSHWLVAAVCSFGHFLKAIFFVLLPER